MHKAWWLRIYDKACFCSVAKRQLWACGITTKCCSTRSIEQALVMAGPNPTASIEITLEEISLGARRLRFIDWTSLKKLNLVSKTEGTHMPLFLGADVLAECPITVANQPRTHAKFAKKGFAAKVYFPQSVRIVDVHGTSRGLWFYTIQGLFRVAFEVYSRHEQLECMARLSNVWKARFPDPLLKQDVQIIVESEAADISEGTSLEVAERTGKQTEKNTNRNISSTQTSSDERQQNQGPKDCPVSRIQLFEASLSQNKETRAGTGEKIGHCLPDVLFEIIQEYEQREQNMPCQEDQDDVLLVISQWLGKKFHSFQSEIEAKVTIFKERHISSIDNLPPAEQVVEELYPVCMRDFLLAWMGTDLGRGKQADQQERNPETQSMFPCIQLILELGNQILVSGVGHVLCSRLNKTNCV